MKKEPLVDQGFELGYHRLSYRRRMIRSLWLIPFCGFFFLEPVRNIAMFGIRWLPLWLFGIICIVGAIGQAAYNYVLWKREA